MTAKNFSIFKFVSLENVWETSVFCDRRRNIKIGQLISSNKPVQIRDNFKKYF